MFLADAQRFVVRYAVVKRVSTNSPADFLQTLVSGLDLQKTFSVTDFKVRLVLCGIVFALVL